jgi:hypothetical protein
MNAIAFRWPIALPSKVPKARNEPDFVQFLIAAASMRSGDTLKQGYDRAIDGIGVGIWSHPIGAMSQHLAWQFEGWALDCLFDGSYQHASPERRAEICRKIQCRYKALGSPDSWPNVRRNAN